LAGGRFAKGLYMGVTFAIDTSSVPGFQYASLSMNGENTLTAIDATTLTPVMVNANANAEVKVVKTAKGDKDGSVDVTYSYKDCPGVKYVQVDVLDANGKVIGRSLLTAATDKKGEGKVTAVSNMNNADVKVVVKLLDAKGDVLYMSDQTAAKTK
jgi:hypothetical protein